MDNLGLMAPIPSEARRRYDEAAARKRGWGGLLTSVAEPLEWLPGPAGDVAQAAATIGREGAEPTAILKAISQALMPQVLGKAKGTVKMIERAPTRASRESLVELAKDPLGPRAMQFFKDTKTHVDKAANVRREFPDTGAGPTKEMLKRLNKITKEGFIETVEGRNKDLFSHPELYDRYPDLADMPISLKFRPFGFEEHRPSGAYRPEPLTTSRGVIPENVEIQFGKPEKWEGRTPYDTWLHEMAHAVQKRNQLPGGADDIRIRDMLVEALRAKGVSNAELLDPTFRKRLDDIAYTRYWNTLGENDARLVVHRSRVGQKTLDQVHPLTGSVTEQGLHLPQTSIVVNPYDPSQIDTIAERLAKFLVK